MLGNNWVNDKMYEPDRTNLGNNAMTRSHGERVLTPEHQPGFRLQRGPRGWRRHAVELNNSTAENHITGSRMFSPQTTRARQGLISTKFAKKNGDIFDFNKADQKERMMKEFNDKVKVYQDKLALLNDRVNSQQRVPSNDVMSRISGNSI